MSLTCPQWISCVPSNSEGRLTDLSCIFLFMQIISTVALLVFFGGPLCASRRPYPSLPPSPERFSQIWSSQANQSETLNPLLLFFWGYNIHSIIMYICIFRIFLYPWKRSYVRWRLCPRWGFLRWCSRYWLVWRQMNTFWNHTFYKNWKKTWTQAHTKHTRYHKNIYSILSNIPYSVFQSHPAMFFWIPPISHLVVGGGRVQGFQFHEVSQVLEGWRCHSFWVKRNEKKNMITWLFPAWTLNFRSECWSLMMFECFRDHSFWGSFGVREQVSSRRPHNGSSRTAFDVHHKQV